MSGRQTLVYRIEWREFPPDFPQRLERLREASQLSWRGLARALRLHPRSLRRWRRGAKPDAAHLLALFGFAAEQGLLHCLMTQPQQGDDDRPDGRLLGEEAEASQEASERFGSPRSGAQHKVN